jgi:hypothetical protein
MMTRIHFVCAFLLAASTAACVSPKIGYDYDSSTNFNGYHVYEWMPGDQEKTGDRRADSSQLDIRIRTAVAARLHLKGYTTSVSAQPDFYVAYHLEMKDLTPNSSTRYYSDGMAGKSFSHTADTRSTGAAHPTTGEAQSFLAGTLLIDIIDAASKQVVWRGTAAGEIDPGLTSKERDERIRNIVHDMLAHFPPK